MDIYGFGFTTIGSISETCESLEREPPRCKRQKDEVGWNPVVEKIEESSKIDGDLKQAFSKVVAR